MNHSKNKLMIKEERILMGKRPVRLMDQTPVRESEDDFMNIPDGIDDELPFR